MTCIIMILDHFALSHVYIPVCDNYCPLRVKDTPSSAVWTLSNVPVVSTLEVMKDCESNPCNMGNSPKYPISKV